MIDRLFSEHPWLVVAAFLGAPPLLFFVELFVLAVVP